MKDKEYDINKRHPKSDTCLVCKYYSYGDLLKEIEGMKTKEIKAWIKKERKRLSVFK